LDNCRIWGLRTLFNGSSSSEDVQDLLHHLTTSLVTTMMCCALLNPPGKDSSSGTEERTDEQGGVHLIVLGGRVCKQMVFLSLEGVCLGVCHRRAPDGESRYTLHATYHMLLNPPS